MRAVLYITFERIIGLPLDAWYKSLILADSFDSILLRPDGAVKETDPFKALSNPFMPMAGMKAGSGFISC